MLRIALAQMRVVPGHPVRNTETMREFIADARKQNADLVIFPEMTIPGYLLGDTWEQTAFLEECEACGEEIIAASKGIAVMFGNVAIDWKKKNNDGRARKYNAFFTAKDGRLITPEGMPYPFVVKTLLPNYREFDDTRHFFSLQKLARELGASTEKLLSPIRLSIRGTAYAVGCLLCEDGWSDDYELSPMKILGEKEHPDFFVNISASPFTLGKDAKRHRVFSRRAAEAHAPLLYVNNVGIQNNGKTVYTFDGANAVYDAAGVLRLSGAPYEETTQIFDLETIAGRPPVELPEEPEAAPIFRALSYGVRLFLASIGMQRVVVGVSGGIDSAVAAALYAKILPPENLLLVNMPSRYNSETTKGLARRLAENLGCRYLTVPIQASVEHTIQQFETATVENLFDGTTERLSVSSFTAENIQARDRSSRVLAGLAAAFGGGFT
ncbi:MAG: NAD(+) synthase, partial [Schwartzia sp.]|nr:NAD(+) synthase [Schwartzia sp. (in: firmicutes)]